MVRRMKSEKEAQGDKPYTPALMEMLFPGYRLCQGSEHKRSREVGIYTLTLTADLTTMRSPCSMKYVISREYHAITSATGRKDRRWAGLAPSRVSASPCARVG